MTDGLRYRRWLRWEVVGLAKVMSDTERQRGPVQRNEQLALGRICSGQLLKMAWKAGWGSASHSRAPAPCVELAGVTTSMPRRPADAASTYLQDRPKPLLPSIGRVLSLVETTDVTDGSYAWPNTR